MGKDRTTRERVVAWTRRRGATAVRSTDAGASFGDPALDEYQASRPTPHRDNICNAPLTNLYFQADGRAAPCWKYFPTSAPYWSPERSIRDIWFGPELSKVRAAHARHEFIDRCAECEHDIRAGNQPLAAAYDNDRPIGQWPTMVELELSNLCNLECVMCNGLLSSRIRKYREHLEPLAVPYDETFVDQLVELLPHLHELRINGGEPMLQPLVHRLGDQVAEHRPDLRMTIATNGTVLNRKVERLLDRCTVHLNISIDSLIPDRYEQIRVRADYDTLMANLDVFQAYARERNRTLCIMVNPMRDNWREMPEFIRWANTRMLPVWFNTILEPAQLALHSLDKDTLASIVDHLQAQQFPSARNKLEKRNAAVYGRLVHQIGTWRDAAAASRASAIGTPIFLHPRRNQHKP